MYYQEKLRLAKEALDSSSYDKETIEYIFPELRETEDERIRKCVKILVNGLNEEHFVRCGASLNEIHAWLEKQRENPSIEGTFINVDDVRDNFMNEVYRVLDTDSTNERANQIIDAFDSLPTVEKQSNHNEENYWEKCKSCQCFDGYDICLHRKNFGSITDESKENCKNKKFFIEKECEQRLETKFNVGDVISDGSSIVTINDFGKDGYIISNGETENDSNAVNWIIRFEDQDKWKLLEQNKVEPKFKVGDWIVYCNEDIDLITGIEDKGYIINKGGYIPFTCEEGMRYWTIQDAKDGDVIVFNDDFILIFKEIHYENTPLLYNMRGFQFKSYIELDFLMNVFEQGNFYDDTGNKCHPATKEQREVLFTKMKESGYEWDAEKKELKKIEQNPVEPVTVVERDGEKWVRVCAFGEDFLIASHDYRNSNKTHFTWKEASEIGTFSKKQAYIVLILKDEINARLKEIGGEPLDSYYWISSEFGQNGAWYTCFNSGSVDNCYKYPSGVARKVIAF